ncbi:MAG TPA: tyrosinase family protein [Longimicrobium sp.]|nr:tyrosinase family protein [Longimicrobium sp.]
MSNEHAPNEAPASRRQFLARTGALAAGGLVAARSAAVAQPPQAPAPVIPEVAVDESGRVRPLRPAQQLAAVTRYDVATFTEGSAQLTLLRQAVQTMRNRADSDPTSWMYQANIHNIFCNTPPAPYGVVHYSWRFLAWHRAYLWYFEKVLQDAVGNDPRLTLPYWNWTTELNLPATYFGASNPLNDPTRQVTPTSKLDPRRTAISGLLALPTFTQFGGSASDAGALETGPHNYVHSWVCGDMCRFSTAARDPIFWAHHANVDRVWYLWNQEGNTNPTDTAWTGQTYPFYDVTQKKNVTISFGDAAQLPVTYAPPVGTTISTGGRKRLNAPVTVQALPAGGELDVAPAASAGSLRVVAIDVPQDAPISVNVFARSGATAQTPTSDPSFVGAFTLIPTDGGHGAHGPVNLHVPLARLAPRLLSAEARTPLNLTLVPTATPGNSRMGTVSFERLELQP